MRTASRMAGDERWSAPLTLLPRPLLEARRPLLTILIGWLTAFLPSILLGAAVSGLLPDLGQPELALNNPVALTMVTVVAPLIETLIMAAVLGLLMLFVSPTFAVLLSAAGWGIAHSLAAPAWGLVIWWPFVVFSTLFVTWRQRSLLYGLAMPAIVHSLHNLLPALAMFTAIAR